MPPTQAKGINTLSLLQLYRWVGTGLSLAPKPDEGVRRGSGGRPPSVVNDNTGVVQWLRTSKFAATGKNSLETLQASSGVFERTLVTALDRGWPSDCTLLCGNTAEFWKLVELAHRRRSHLCL